MTLLAAWIRKDKSTEELVIATDSRLRFGAAWDCCPKILMLPRSDAVLCFAGDTMYAYPIMLQIRNAIEMYGKARSRAMDITDLRGHILRIIEDMRNLIYDRPSGSDEHEPTDFRFILAGYSWKFSGFKIWILHYQKNINRFSFKSVSSHQKQTKGTKHFFFEGDEVGTARKKLYDILRSRNKMTTGGLDMEPFEVLRDMIRDAQYVSIGGPPQIVKIYKHMNSLPYNVFWPNREAKRITFLGRPLLHYEKNRYLALDPDALDVFDPQETWESS
jgi:hypothetical protein